MLRPTTPRLTARQTKLNESTVFAIPLRRSIGVANVIIAVWAAGGVATAASNPTPVPPVAQACQHFAPGSTVQQPPALFSKNGVLNVSFSYQTNTDKFGRQLFCFITPSGLENPTLYVNPGDTLNVTVTNNTPVVLPTDPNVTTELYNPPNCGDTTAIELNQANSGLGVMTGGSMNIHYHGTNTTPACHGDNVVKTLVNPGTTFSYSLAFPTNEPPGLYWYHPHVHGLAEAAVQGGSTGAIVVQGIQNVQPAVGGLRQRIILVRDQPTTQNLTPANGGTEGGIPTLDLTVNNISINTTTNVKTGVTTYTPAVLQMAAGSQEFWRVANTDSDQILDLQVRFDGNPQTIQVVGIDGVPVNSQDGTQPGRPVAVTHFMLPPAARVEFLVNAPSPKVKVAQLVTQNILSGPLGDSQPTRPLINMQLGSGSGTTPVDGMVPASTGVDTSKQMFGGIANQTPSLTRTIFFEELQDGSAFFINFSGCVTAAGAKCATQPYPIDTPFDNNNPPAFITTQGSVEKWIIQNHAQENHEFHQHQIHFQVMAQNNYELNGNPSNTAMNGQFADMIEVPFWDNVKNPNPSQVPAAVLLMDFRGMDVGQFVYHCHILSHEDLGMMQIIQVNPGP